jgi:hypothetical protein
MAAIVFVGNSYARLPLKIEFAVSCAGATGFLSPILLQDGNVESKSNQGESDHPRDSPRPMRRNLHSERAFSPAGLAGHRESRVGVALQVGVTESMDRDSRLQERIASLRRLQLRVAYFHSLLFHPAAGWLISWLP